MLVYSCSVPWALGFQNIHRFLLQDFLFMPKIDGWEKRVLFMECVMSIQQMDFNLQNQMSISRAIYAHT